MATLTYPPPHVRHVLRNLRGFCRWAATPEAKLELNEMSAEDWLHLPGSRHSPFESMIFLTNGKGLTYIKAELFRAHAKLAQIKISSILEEMEREQIHAERRVERHPRSRKFQQLLTDAESGCREAREHTRRWIQPLVD